MTRPHPFHVMTKPIGPRCNIDCSYCYYLEKERLYPDEKKFRMREDVLESYVRGLIEASVKAGQREVAFTWQGGEPTMLGLGFFKHAVAVQRQYCPEGLKITNSLQTNGILVDDTWAEFFRCEDFLIGISIDGPKAIHDRYRRDRAGRPSFDAVMRGLGALRRQGAAYNILTTIHRANAAKGKDIYRFLRNLGTAHLQFIPIVERETAQGQLATAPQMSDARAAVTSWSVSPKAYGKFLCDVFDIWYRQDIGRVFVQFFETQIGLWAGYPASLCVFAETCGNALALEHNGDLYACDHFVYPDYRLGNIGEAGIGTLAWSDKARRFGADKRDRLTRQCQSCSFRFACNGGCPKHRIHTSRDGDQEHNYFCESYTMFFRHAGTRLRGLGAGVLAGRG
jgi:uncharacterized protein